MNLGFLLKFCTGSWISFCEGLKALAYYWSRLFFYISSLLTELALAKYTFYIVPMMEEF